MRERVARVVALRPLSVGAAASLLGREYQRAVAPEFASACHEATRGNPFYLRELIRALRADGIDPSAAQVSRVAGQGPASGMVSVDPDRGPFPRGGERRTRSGRARWGGHAA